MKKNDGGGDGLTSFVASVQLRHRNAFKRHRVPKEGLLLHEHRMEMEDIK